MKTISILIPMKLAGQAAKRTSSGYAMAALLVAMSIMAIMMTVVMPVWKQTAQREKEEELIFRGKQYVHAIGAVPAQVRQRVPAEPRCAGRAAVPAQEVQGPDHERRFPAASRGRRPPCRRRSGRDSPAAGGQRGGQPARRRAGTAPPTPAAARRARRGRRPAGGGRVADSARRARAARRRASAASPARARTNRFASTTAAITTTSGRSSTSSSNRRPAPGAARGSRSRQPRHRGQPARPASAAALGHRRSRRAHRSRGVRTARGPAARPAARHVRRAAPRPSSRCRRTPRGRF